MQTPSLQTSTTLSPAALDELHQRTAGTLHTPGSPQWDAARMPWLVNVDQHPVAVLEVADRDDVVSAVRWAEANGLQVIAQPRGHGAGADLQGALLLRTRALAGIEVDLARHRVRVGAGVSSGELAAALAGTGLTFLAGSNPDPSVVGLTITGGISWFGRAYGLGCDSIVSAEVVDGRGRVREVSADEEPELLWALRGGGGDFAVIVSMELALHPAPALYGGRMFWPVEAMGEVLRTFRAVCADAPDELTSWYHTLAFPPLPEVPEPLRGRSFASVFVTYLGAAEQAEALLAPYRAVPGLEMDLMGPLGVEEVPHLAGEPTDPIPSMISSTLLRDLDDEAIDLLVAAVGADSRTPLLVMQIRHLGGALALTPPDAGCHGAITEPFNIQSVGILPVPDLVPVVRAACDQVGAAVAHLSTGRTMMNFLDHDEPCTWWDDATRARLEAVKAAVDPIDTIRSNRPVRRSASAVG